jgi:hypothetical protein
LVFRKKAEGSAKLPVINGICLKREMRGKTSGKKSPGIHVVFC